MRGPSHRRGGPAGRSQGWGVPQDEKGAASNGDVSKEVVSPGDLGGPADVLGDCEARAFVLQSPERSRGLSHGRCMASRCH